MGISRSEMHTVLLTWALAEFKAKRTGNTTSWPEKSEAKPSIPKAPAAAPARPAKPAAPTLGLEDEGRENDDEEPSEVLAKLRADRDLSNTIHTAYQAGLSGEVRTYSDPELADAYQQGRAKASSSPQDEPSDTERPAAASAPVSAPEAGQNPFDALNEPWPPGHPLHGTDQ